MTNFTLTYKLVQEFEVEVEAVDEVEAKEKAPRVFDFTLAACERCGDVAFSDFDLVGIEKGEV